MVLTGTYKRSLDQKNRIAIPKKLREQFSAKDISNLYIIPGTETSLSIYSPETFDQLSDRLKERTTNKSTFRNYLRLLYSRSEEVPIDQQGRIRIPDRLVNLANLDNEIMLIGVQDHAEIWSMSNWDSFLNSYQDDFDELATKAFEE